MTNYFLTATGANNGIKDAFQFGNCLDENSLSFDDSKYNEYQEKKRNRVRYPDANQYIYNLPKKYNDEILSDGYKLLQNAEKLIHESKTLGDPGKVSKLEAYTRDLLNQLEWFQTLGDKVHNLKPNASDIKKIDNLFNAYIKLHDACAIETPSMPHCFEVYRFLREEENMKLQENVKNDEQYRPKPIVPYAMSGKDRIEPEPPTIEEKDPEINIAPPSKASY